MLPNNFNLMIFLEIGTKLISRKIWKTNLFPRNVSSGTFEQKFFTGNSLNIFSFIFVTSDHLKNYVKLVSRKNLETFIL